jgi:excisionase family DNA binding protein
MNLADAIRMASQSGNAPAAQPAVTEARESSTIELFTHESGPATKAASATIVESSPQREQKMKHTHEAHEAPNGHKVVRMEFVLAPDQLKRFFGAVIASQHGVLTLREAAHFLRVSQRSLEGMAHDGDVPGMMVDGKWRFTRQALEDWLGAHPNKKEA